MGCDTWAANSFQQQASEEKQWDETGQTPSSPPARYLLLEDYAPREF
jgi:hypothetical protein